MKFLPRWGKVSLIFAAILSAVFALNAAMGAESSGKKPAEVAPQKTEDNVRITVQTVPPRKALVKWGNKNLGMIPAPKPLVVVRPRDSGPLDLVIRASGFIAVHTRAYTFSDSRLAVKLTPVAEKNTLFGYREELPPEGSTPDGGVAPPEPPKPVPAPAGPPVPAPGPPVPQQ